MSKFTKSAKGQECQVRLPVACNYNNETVVLAHLNGAGMGLKKNDIHSSFACSSCHDELDGRTRVTGYSNDELRLAAYQGMERTQNIWLKMGWLGE